MAEVPDRRAAFPRRHLLGGAAALAPALLAGCTAGEVRAPAPAAAKAPPALPAAVAAEGARQAGVDRPAQPQQHVELAVYDLPASPAGGGRATARRVLAELGERIRGLCGGGDPLLAGMRPGDLTVTVGVGPRLVRLAGEELPGAGELPVFAREAVAEGDRGGDLMVQVCAGDPQVAVLAGMSLRAAATALSVRPRWSQDGFRPPAAAPGGPVRNLLGFLDGVSVPRTPEETDREVWLPGPGPVRDGTVAVVRRMRLDVPGFLALGVPAQEAAVGRRRADGAPLSGGGPDAAVDLGAKSAAGRYLVPAMAHVRRAHPAETGSGLMLRRGYSYANSAADRGLLFVSFQRELRTFTQTQARLDEGDALMAFATATASGSFLVLPGFSAERPLGASLFG